jgi:hypothetical protein
MKRTTIHNRRLAQWRVTWLIEHSTSHQLLWCIDSFELRNPTRTQSVETLDKIRSAHFVQRPRATHVSDFRSRSEHSSNTCLAQLSLQRFAFPCQ